jgi:hypothetical protein
MKQRSRPKVAIEVVIFLLARNSRRAQWDLSRAQSGENRYPVESPSMSLTTRHRLVISLILVGSLAVFAAARMDIALAATRRAVLVGVVLPRHANPGERISGSLVSHPNDYKSIPGLIVEPVEMELPVDETGKPKLDDAFVDTGNGRSRGARRFTATVPSDGSPLELTCGSSETARKARFDFEPRSGTQKNAGYTMQPIAPDSGVSVIHGNFDGDSDRTDIRVNDTRAKVVAESLAAAFYSIPSSSVNGRNRVTLTQDGRTFSWDMYQPDVEIGAAKTTLEQDESTNFNVTVNLEGLPAKDWQPGNPSDLYDTTHALASARELGRKSNGLIVVTVKNKSRDTVSLSPADRFSVPFTNDDRTNGSKEIDGTVTAKRAGGFEIDASLVSMLADVPGQELPTRGERVTRNGDHENEREPHHTDLVTGVPVAAVPKCCVITGITLTNNFSSRAFFVLNGKYQLGMSPPPNEWVEPGQSRTFKGDFGECVRIEAFNNVPPDGEFVDTVVCCKDLLSGKQHTGQFTYSIDSIAWREPGDCPGAPPPPPPPLAPPLKILRVTPTPTLTPTETPTATPTNTPTPTATESETPTVSQTPIGVAPPSEEEVDCPQRGKGCAALIIDNSETHFWEASFKGLSDPLKALKCKVDEAYPNFWIYDRYVVMKVRGHVLAYSKNDEDKLEAEAHNTREWRKIHQAILAHRATLNSGTEIALEFINAHGSPGAPGEIGESKASGPRCGRWSTDYYTGPPENLPTNFWDRDRSWFHTADHGALFRNTCDWFAYDASCFSGQTPMAIDELENNQPASCSGRDAISCLLHGGYEADLAGGVQISTLPGMNGTIKLRAGQLESLLRSEVFRMGINAMTSKPTSYEPLAAALRDWLTGEKFILGGAAASYYTDKGYHGDQPPPPEHPHEGY